MENSVIFIYSDLHIGGIQTLIYRKSRWLIENGYDVYLITSSRGTMHKMFEENHIKVLINDELFYGSVDMNVLLNNINKIVTSIPNIKNIKVVECFEPVNSIMGIIISKLVNTKFISGVYHPKAYVTGFEKKNQGYKNLLNLLDEFDSCIYMNQDVLNSHENFYEMKVKNRNILRLPVDIKKKREMVQRTEEFTVLSIGRLVDFKKYVYGLVKDFDEFYTNHSNSRLIIIGDGKEKKSIINFSKKLKSYKAGKIEFLGTVPYDKIDSYLYNASLVVGMGTSILEMASAGIPSIVAPVYVDHNISNGFVFEDDNVGDKKNDCTNTYKYYMETLYNCTDDKYISVANDCRKYVEENYSINDVMNKWLDLVSKAQPIVLSSALDNYVIKSPLQRFLSIKRMRLITRLKVIFR